MIHIQGMNEIAASFRAQTNKRVFSSPFEEDGSTWIIDAAGHQWCLVDGTWEQFTDEDDPHVLDLARQRRAASRARRAA